MAEKTAAAPRKSRKAALPRIRARAAGEAIDNPGDKPVGERLIPPDGGATVRMYRTGHGDCFLLAFAPEPPEPGAGRRKRSRAAEESARKPFYVLIDCGYKPGSPKFIDTSAREITASIREATGGHVDVAVITHEHQDHVNGITEANFQGITIGETWLAWTEDPDDPVANKLRAQFKDKLLGLLAAQSRLAADDPDTATRIEEFIAFEFGGDDDDWADGGPGLAGLLAAAGGDPANSRNKQAMKLFKERAEKGVRYIRPHQEIMPLPGTAGVRVFALGPPRDPEQLQDLDPRGAEEFHGLALSSASAANYFAAAAGAPETHGVSPFAARYAIPEGEALRHGELGPYFALHYGDANTPEGFDPESGERGDKEVPDNPAWRRIDKEWLYSAERLALDMNDQTNNASLVLAFELGRGGKVLLFAADAQRGNWISWGNADWRDGDGTVTARDLLARTVLYKVGHHGSHNATLNGVPGSEHASLGWMAQGKHGREFTSMITAVRKWAETQKGWDHPLKAIKDALLKKASGRVFQTDTPLEEMARPDGVSGADWKRFLSRVREDRLYFDYDIPG